MNTKNLFAALCMTGLLMLPIAGMARMSSLSDDQLQEVTGQAGFSDAITHITFDTHLDEMPIMGGLFNFSDVTIQGSIDAKNLAMDALSMTQVFGGGIPGLGTMGLGAIGLGTHYVDTVINVNRLTVGAIRPGSDTTGPSLGSLCILGMRADIKGVVSVTAH